MKTNPVQLAYGRGYSAGLRRLWPPHKPPVPPEPVIAELLAALETLCASMQAELATFTDDDPLVVALLEPLARARAAATAVTEWLAEPAAPSGTDPNEQ